ncbi:GDSL esterase/lipase At1g33811 isoform X3 [Cannabis sativa]|uniref:GDSL esterase/lipase At1g33811 isoform X3 n=1 Tax=Cannabis sativa TaxID=3483 RepID=UPI0029CA6FD1|nr:GDSL esterase/lipase At1g33811 isoform X3 [Cannabis sativa]
MKLVMVVLMMIILLHDHNYGVNGDSQPQVPCLYIFGDSLSDNGNNNKLPTLSKANYKPYEIDFSNPNANYAISPTGRFTNGRTTIDIIGQLLGFDDFIPPFANTTGYDIVKGVNYASGGCGILPESGKYLRLYSNSSARKVALVGLGQLGSTPAVIALYGINGITKVNQKVQLFNQNLISLVHKLNTKFSDAKFIYVNNYGIQSGDLSSLGLTNVSESCCETNNIGLCIPSSTTCDNRTSYVFWDEFHTTETLNKFTANRSYTSLHASDNYPIDIKHLAQLQF